MRGVYIPKSTQGMGLSGSNFHVLPWLYELAMIGDLVISEGDPLHLLTQINVVVEIPPNWIAQAVKNWK